MAKVVEEEAYVFGRVVLVELLETQNRHKPRFSFEVQADDREGSVTVFMEPRRTHSPEIFNAAVAIVTAAYITEANVFVDHSPTPDPDDGFERMNKGPAYAFRAIEIEKGRGTRDKGLVARGN